MKEIRLAVNDTILPYDELKGFAPKERDTYVQNAIARILEKHRKGLTVSEVSSKTRFSRPTVAKHLDILVAIGEAYKVERGNLSIYYKNGKIVREIDTRSVSTPDKTYTLYLLENDEGEFLYVQERELDEFRSVRVRGGIMINTEDVPTVFKAVEELRTGRPRE